MGLNDDHSEHAFQLAKRLGAERYFKKEDDFKCWLTDFQSECISTNRWSENARLKNNSEISELAGFLNYCYWSQYAALRDHVYSQKRPEYGRIEHYKIAAIIEYIIIKFSPFEYVDGRAYNSLVTDFALYVIFRLIIAWNEAELNHSVINFLATGNEPTRKFIEEHRIWLERKDVLTTPSVIFSNMQTIRLLHYWFREPNESFKSLD